VLEQVRSLERKSLRSRAETACQGDELILQAVDVNSLKVLAAQLEGTGRHKTLRHGQAEDKLKTAVIVLLAAVDGSKGARSRRV
jgi:alanyl-tRNA synthetase